MTLIDIGFHTIRVEEPWRLVQVVDPGTCPTHEDGLKQLILHPSRFQMSSWCNGDRGLVRAAVQEFAKETRVLLNYPFIPGELSAQAFAGVVPTFLRVYLKVDALHLRRAQD